MFMVSPSQSVESLCINPNPGGLFGYNQAVVIKFRVEIQRTKITKAVMKKNKMGHLGY